MQTTYETEKLLLKLPDIAFAGLVSDYYIRNKAFLQEWEEVRDEEFFTKEHQAGLLDMECQGVEKKAMLKFWILKKDGPERIIGSVCFSNIVRGPFLSCFLGYKLDKDEINRGIITEAVKKGIEIIFRDFGLHRIEANIMPKNKRSLRVAEKLGFKNEGLSQKYLKINGKWEDHIHMVLLNED